MAGEIFEYPYNVRAFPLNGTPAEVLALAINVDVARAAYEAALKTRDLTRYQVVLCNGTRVMRRTGEESR